MSFPVRDLVLSHKGLPGGQKHVLAALSFWAKHDGTGVYPRVQEVADRCGMSVRQVQRCIRAMEDTEILVVVSRSSGKRGQSNHWNIDLEVLTGARVSICHPSRQGDDGCQSVTRDDRTGDTSGPDGCHFGRDGVTLMSPPIDNHQVSNHQENNTQRAREPVQRNLNLMSPITGDKPVYPTGFELIWTELSRCPGFTALMGKHEAFLAYEALADRPSDAEFCRAARGYGRHLAQENARRPASSPHPMLSPVNWFAKYRFAQFLDTPDPLGMPADDPPTIEQADRARLLEGGFSGPEIDVWFGHAAFAVRGDELHITVRKPFIRNWVANHFVARLEKAWTDHGTLSVHVLDVSQERAA